MDISIHTQNYGSEMTKMISYMESRGKFSETVFMGFKFFLKHILMELR
jgi:hypothetical protein